METIERRRVLTRVVSAKLAEGLELRDRTGITGLAWALPETLVMISSDGFAKTLQETEGRRDRSQPMNAGVGLDAIEGQKYLNLETYRRSGKAVRTPVWFATAPAEAGERKLYVYTTANSGKAKRIRRTGVAKIAPCNSRGRIIGEWIAAHAQIVGGEEFACGMRLLNRKYRPWKQILDLSLLLFAKHQRIMIVIRAA